MIMTQYRYQALDHDDFRLLQLEPSLRNEPIKCKLQHVSMSGPSLPRYETVSYCWGDRNCSVEIEIENTVLRLPQSTAEVLRRFRHSSKSRVLWIDAVCINQEDMQERGVQVAQMHKIYASATNNLIWLGEEDERTGEAVENINRLIKEIELETDSFNTLPFSGGPNFYLHRSSGLKQHYELQPILRLCFKPWFGRMWVVQEASLASSNLCHCGPYTFDLITLLRVAKWIWTKRDFLDLGLYTDAQRVLSRAWRISDFADKQCGWFHHARRKGWFSRDAAVDAGAAEVSLARHMLTVLRNFACSQPIDHIFGLAGLYREFAQTELPELLRPDYRKSVSDAFIDATRQTILEGDDLVTLHDIYHRIEDDEAKLDLPSWVPQWHQPWNVELDPTPLHRGYRASGEWTLSSIGSVDSGRAEIDLEGFFVDGAVGARVEAVTERFLERNMTGHFLNTVEELVNNHAVKVDDMDKALAATLCAEESAERGVATGDDLLGYGDLKAYFEKSRTEPTPDLSIKEAPPELRRAARYSEAAWRACSRRKFFITTGGRIGIGPQTMQVGDVVTILYGAEWPIALRKRDTDYELIGLCYVYGIMGGQAVQEHEERGDEDVWFRIR